MAYNHQYHHHRSPSPREIDDLPEAFHCYAGSSNGSPPGLNSSLPQAAIAQGASTTPQWQAFSPVVSPSSVPLSLKRSRDDLERGESVEGATRTEQQRRRQGHEAEGEGIQHKRDIKGKGRAIQVGSTDDEGEEDCQMDHGIFQDPASFGLPISLANAAIPPTNPRPYHPQNAEHAHNNGSNNLPFNGFGVKGTPGGDCKRICVRHQRMVDAGARLDLQKRLDTLSETEQQTANTIWSLFSASSGAARLLTLRGLLSICCPSQLSFLSEQLKAECRMDPFAALPRELALRCMSFLDAMSLGRAAQVSKSWKALADDDLLWRTMCEQHIERKCEKCGWGLPLLEKKRRQKSPAANVVSASMAQAQAKYDNATHNHTPLPKTLEEALSPANMSANSTKRSRLQRNASSSANFEALNHNSPVQSSFSTLPPQSNSTSAAPSSSSASGSALQRQQTPTILPQITRPWKSVYCERLAIARNWARGNCKFRVLTGHTDAITCLQIDETLSNPPYPVLMTGSWDRTVRIWNAESGQCVSILRGHTRGVRCLQFDSVKLITGGMDAKIKLWNWKTGKCLRTLEGHRDSVISLCFDKQVLASGSSDSTIKVWDFNTAECYTLRGHREWVNQVKIWSPDSSSDCTVTPAENELTRSTGDSSSNNGFAPQASMNSGVKPSIKLLFSSSDDGTVKIWDLITRQCVRTLEGHVAQVQCLRILSVDDHSSAPFPVQQNKDDQTSYINASEGSGTAANNRSQVTDGNAYEGFFDNQQGVQGQQSHQEQQQIAGGPTTAPATFQQAFVPASQLSQAAPNPLAFLEAANRPAPDPSTLPFIDFGNSPAPLLVSGSLDNTIKVWNVEEGTCARTMFGHIEGVWAVDMDKLRIVSASHDRTIKVWDRNGGKCLHTLVGHRGAVTSIGLGDDKIISGSDDCTVRIWSFAQ